MKLFAELIKKLDNTNKTSLKVAALSKYFQQAPDADKVWTIAILSHRRPPRPVNATLLRQWAAELLEIPSWLFEESYHIVGDLAETIALILPAQKSFTAKSLSTFLEEIIALKVKTDAEKRAYLQSNWLLLNFYERLVFTKLITGGFRIGVSQKLMTRALSVATGIAEDALACRLMGNWDPASISFHDLIIAPRVTDNSSTPYPFYLAHALDMQPELLGDCSHWNAEHKWDGIRSQTIVRNNQVFIWTRGEELVTTSYPEFEWLAQYIPNGTVIDGEILPFINGQIGSFNDLQSRIGRKVLSKKIVKEIPVVIKAYDLLEWKGADIREKSYDERRQLLEALFYDLKQTDLPLQLSERLSFNSWDEVAQERMKARAYKSEGLMIKRKNSKYLVGRKKGDWWKWKTAPLTIDAVLTYAMRGHGRRTNLFTDYTFALWENYADGSRQLVTFAKAYSGLTLAEFKKVDDWIKKNTINRFGPVRSVVPELVFEIAFEGVNLSSRHKSGVATRFPRILRWRIDKTIEEANTIEDLKLLIQK